MRDLYLISVWLHILAAMAWIGGMLFLGLVLVPVIRKPPLRDHMTLLLYRTGLRFRQVGWGAFAVLIVTGIFNVSVHGYGWSDLWNGSIWAGGWGRALGIKLVLVLAVLVVSAVHDFYVGPHAVTQLERDPDAPASQRVRKTASWMGRIVLLLSLGILAMAVTLPRGGL